MVKVVLKRHMEISVNSTQPGHLLCPKAISYLQFCIIPVCSTPCYISFIMRNIALLTSFLPLAVSAQFIVLSFEATLNGTPAPLDSVLVMNLTQGGDTMIYFPENTLVLGGATALDELSAGGIRMQCLPNPFSGATDIVLGTEQPGEMQVLVHDEMGRELASHRSNPAPGQHRFRYTTCTSGLQVLSVLCNGQWRSMRMVATEGGTGGGHGLAYMGAMDLHGGTKDDRSLFQWQPGDLLRYIGYGNSGGFVASASIDEAPTVTTTHIFPLVLGAVCIDAPTVTDIMGNVYPVVRIGDQCWMGTNLRTDQYRDGTTIPQVTSDVSWTQQNSGARCNYENNFSAYNATYGKLYNWYAAANPNLCPLGWHVPTDAEWQQLEEALGMPGVELDQQSTWRGSAQNVGGKLKTLNLWDLPNLGATNETGFSALPGGKRNGEFGFFSLLGSTGFLWSSSENGAIYGWSRSLSFGVAGIWRSGSDLKQNGFCVRCIRD